VTKVFVREDRGRQADRQAGGQAGREGEGLCAYACARKESAIAWTDMHVRVYMQRSGGPKNCIIHSS
jgi:hypothetical protein